MKNREVFVRDPVTATLPNNGVVAISESYSKKEIEALRYELEHFVCEGQYHAGLMRILDSYLAHVKSPSQPAAWISGFYGSGKSHLLKILRHLWANTPFSSDGARARDLAHLPDDIKNALVEIDTFGKRCGGLHSFGGTLPSGGGLSPRLAVLRMLFKSKGLPESLPEAQFCLWLKASDTFEQVEKSVNAALASKGRDFFTELHNLYVSPVLAGALLEADPNFADDITHVRSLIREQFPLQDDLPTSDFVRMVRETLEIDGQMPATLIVLDEVQLYIGNSSERSTDVQEMAEALCKQLDSRVLLISAGQTSLAASDPLLDRLRGRFTVAVELSDADVETVTRKVVLAKKADKRSAIESVLDQNRGEIDRQLSGTQIAARSDDQKTIVDDYPLLPVRRRLWEHVIRVADLAGTSSQLRTQLRMVHDAVRETAEEPLGTVVPADFLFTQQRPGLLQSGALLKEIDETIQTLDDGTPDGVLGKRLCELIFLIRKLPREGGSDIGVRSTPEMLADLLVQNLGTDGVPLRRDVPRVLGRLVESGKLVMLENGEYSLQTRESSEWNREYRNQKTRLNANATSLASKRAELISACCNEVFRGIRLTQGESKEPRKLVIHFGSEPPSTDGTDIPVWIRDGWSESESTVVADARAAGNESPTIFVFIPKASAEELQKAIISYAAAQATIDLKGTPIGREGQEAHDAMAATMNRAEQVRDQIIREVVDEAKVYRGGGNEQLELALAAKVETAAIASMDRMFPSFNDADDGRWKSVIERARKGDEGALSVLGYTGPVEQHRVTAAVLREVGAGRQGREIRNTLSAPPYGWPRDAIDAALILLHTSGHIRAKYRGVAVVEGELDQNKIPATDLHTESVTLNAN
ncbi:MAG TPA: BREX system P-loop protein BrxC, partial [Actinobacteria bacterium]|nr:BREX system P-loop protein BrxC [Actinomycetota bacterium]